MEPDYQEMADRLQDVVYDLQNMAAGAGTYPYLVAAVLRDIAAALDED
jgi:hypothetical protein